MKRPLAELPYSAHTPEIIAALRRTTEPDAIVGVHVRRFLVNLGWIKCVCCCELTPEGRRVLTEQETEP